MNETLSFRDRFILLLIYLSAFSAAWVLTKEPAEIYSGYIVIFALLPVFIARYGVPGNFWLFSAIFVFSGFLNIGLGNDTTEQFLKIFIGMMLSYLFYFYAFRRFEFDSELLFRYYLRFALIVTYIGIFQFISYRVRFTPGYDFRWLPIFNKWGVIEGGNLGIRINSIFGEPSQYAAVMAPAMFVALSNLISFRKYVYNRWQSILVVVVYLLTFSSLGYMGLFVAIILLMLNYGVIRYVLVFIPLLIGSFFIMYNTVPDFRYRWDSTIRLFETGEIDIHEEHGSSIVFYNNFVVATENFKSNLLLGTGLGSHPVAFDKYSVTKSIEVYGFANNSADANSMLLRIMSETGLFGLILTFIFLRRNFIRRDPFDPDNPRWLISAAMFCIMALYLFRQGHYFLNGFPLFVLMYYYNRKNSEAEAEMAFLASQQEPEEEEEETEESGDWNQAPARA